MWSSFKTKFYKTDPSSAIADVATITTTGAGILTTAGLTNIAIKAKRTEELNKLLVHEDVRSLSLEQNAILQRHMDVRMSEKKVALSKLGDAPGISKPFYKNPLNEGDSFVLQERCDFIKNPATNILLNSNPYEIKTTFPATKLLVDNAVDMIVFIGS